MLGEKVQNINIEGGETVKSLFKKFSVSGGFSSKKLAQASEILMDMGKDKECVKFLSFPADIVSTGTRGVIKDMVKNRMVDIIITTCGTLDHDLARIWKDYYSGNEYADDVHLHNAGINRLYNIFIPNESYGLILEEKLLPILKAASENKKEYSTHELISFVGESISKEEHAEDSIIYWAWKNKVPVIVPGIMDGSFGSQLWFFAQREKEFRVDLIADENMLSDTVFKAKKSGALMIGGGISKHHTIWWNQFKNGLDYAVYITTAVDWDGSLSGAKLNEAVSWGKVKPKAKQVTVEGDATVLLPLLYASVIN